ncbi:sterile alpha motif domain-containing protein 3-like [Rhipicephalus microplus]|uniref:sterile alpha motif domain-containing protein 3-like n=1 Tax=Rhipicephalus microplus TaxID=6941 RepID=UPI003F6D04D7
MEPPEFQYLVSFQGRKKIISARGPTEADILEALKTTDFGHSLQACRIEVYNVRHDEFVDPPAGHVFSEKDKIRLVCSENFLMSCSTTDKVTAVHEVSLPKTLESNEQSPSQQLACCENDYRLPPVPLDIKDAIERTQPGKVSSHTKSRIVGWIANHLMTITVYPGSLYEAAAKSLVLEYPVLRDTIGTGWDSWKVSLKYKFAYMRKSLCTVPAVQAARAAYGKRKDLEESTNTKRHCHVIVDLSQHVASQHDEATINSHIDYMVKEIKRPIPDMQKLGDSMEQTRPSRQKWMKEMRPSTADVVLKYPALAKAEMLHEEFIALTGVNLEKKVLEFINRYGDRCFELAKCRRCAKEAVKAIEEEVEALDGDEKKYRFAVGIVELLPMLLKEQPRFLQGPDTYPALSLKGKNASEATNIVASFEGLSVEVLDVIAGMTALMEIYWIFDVKYSGANKKTFTLLEHFCGLPTSAKQMPLVIRQISSLEKAT